ncbi:hypothetical protein N0V90_002974 [Kalmusia sp. IMI 367209]|nr:hypothetical protein N0V90_002974 [Kalmusia sp. IMI 367209]
MGPAAPGVPALAAVWLPLVDAVDAADVVAGAEVTDAPELEAESEEPEAEFEEPEEAVDAGVDAALEAHEAFVGVSIPYAWQRPFARLMIAGDRSDAARQISDKGRVSTNTFVVKLPAVAQAVAKTIPL